MKAPRLTAAGWYRCSVDPKARAHYFADGASLCGKWRLSRECVPVERGDCQRCRDRLRSRRREELKRDRFRGFGEARDHARGLGLRSAQEWRAYCASGRRPVDIPSAPNRVYARRWISWGDWLGTRSIWKRRPRWRSFPQAREHARSLGLAGQREWRLYCASGRKPDDIPVAPDAAYGDQWYSWGDWLGTGNICSRRRSFRSFTACRRYARGLELASQSEWYRHRPRPVDVPLHPETVYRNLGWISWGDWLGTGSVSTRRRGA